MFISKISEIKKCIKQIKIKDFVSSKAMEERLQQLINKFKSENNVNYTDITCKFDDIAWKILMEESELYENEMNYIISIGWNFKTQNYKEVGTTYTNVELYIRKFKKFLRDVLPEYNVEHMYDGDLGLQYVLVILEKK